MKQGTKSIFKTIRSRYSYILLLLVTFSCQEKKVRESSIDTLVNNSLSSEKTLVEHLNEAYTEKDSVKLARFFQNWFVFIKAEKFKSKSRVESAIYEIYNQVYYPFNLEKYGWEARPRNKIYRYVILPTEIDYVIIDSANELKKTPELQKLYNFYPEPKLDGVAILYDVKPYQTAMSEFFLTESYQKRKFLGKFVKMPKSPEWKEYLTYPKVIKVYVAKNLQSAIVNLILISTELRIRLDKNKGKWSMTEVEELLID